MSHWRKIFTYLLVLAIPVSTLAGFDTNAGCPHASQEMGQIAGQSTDGHCENTTNLKDNVVLAKTSSNDCKCNNSLECANTGLNLTAIATSNKIITPDNLNQQTSYLSNIRLPITLSTLFRPPISNS